MRTKHISFVALAFLMIIIIVPVAAVAQPSLDPGGNPDVPIDGGLSLLLAAGAGYVAKKGYDSRKRKK